MLIKVPKPKHFLWRRKRKHTNSSRGKNRINKIVRILIDTNVDQRRRRLVDTVGVLIFGKTVLFINRWLTWIELGEWKTIRSIRGRGGNSNYPSNCEINSLCRKLTISERGKLSGSPALGQSWSPLFPAFGPTATLFRGLSFLDPLSLD